MTHTTSSIDVQCTLCAWNERGIQNCCDIVGNVLLAFLVRKSFIVSISRKWRYSDYKCCSSLFLHVFLLLMWLCCPSVLGWIRDLIAKTKRKNDFIRIFVIARNERLRETVWNLNCLSTSPSPRPTTASNTVTSTTLKLANTFLSSGCFWMKSQSS